MKCKNCEQKDTKKYSQYSSGEFCSRECARAFSTKDKRKEINKAVSKKMTGSGHGSITNKCLCCKSKFEINWKKRTQKFCSISCNKTYYMSRGNIASLMGKKSAESQGDTRRSKNEIYFAKLCKERFIILENEPMFNGWDADIIIPELKLAILWNGKWHYKKITKEHSVKQVQNRDKIKIKEIGRAGYESYVIKDMGKYNKLFVEKIFKKMLVYLKLS